MFGGRLGEQLLGGGGVPTLEVDQGEDRLPLGAGACLGQFLQARQAPGLVAAPLAEAPQLEQVPRGRRRGSGRALQLLDAGAQPPQRLLARLGARLPRLQLPDRLLLFRGVRLVADRSVAGGQGPPHLEVSGAAFPRRGQRLHRPAGEAVRRERQAQVALDARVSRGRLSGLLQQPQAGTGLPLLPADRAEDVHQLGPVGKPGEPLLRRRLGLVEQAGVAQRGGVAGPGLRGAAPRANARRAAASAEAGSRGSSSSASSAIARCGSELDGNDCAADSNISRAPAGSPRPIRSQPDATAAVTGGVWGAGAGGEACAAAWVDRWRRRRAERGSRGEAARSSSGGF